MIGNAHIPLVPAAVRLGLLPIPTAIIELAFNQLARSVASRHPSIFERLGSHAGKQFALQPTDLPFLITVAFDPIRPTVSVIRPSDGLRTDACIAGPIAALTGLAHGRYDGDALFFSGDLTIQGDVAAILALRNALDDAEIDLLLEAAAMLGPLSGVVERLMRPAARLLEHHTGLALTRGRSADP